MRGSASRAGGQPSIPARFHRLVSAILAATILALGLVISPIVAQAASTSPIAPLSAPGTGPAPIADTPFSDLVPIQAQVDENTSEGVDAGSGAQVQTTSTASSAATEMVFLAACSGIPSAPVQISPADTSSLTTATPTLKIQGLPSDCDGDVVYVNYSVYSASSISSSNRVWKSGWTTQTSMPVPPGELHDGQNYWWQVTAEDEASWTSPTGTVDSPSPKDGISSSGNAWRMTISQPHLGTDPRYQSLDESLGDGMRLSINESNLNALVSVPLGKVRTYAGWVRFGLSYNSQDTGANKGLGAGWRLYGGADSGAGTIPTQISYMSAADVYKVTLESGKSEYLPYFDGAGNGLGTYTSAGSDGDSLRVATLIDTSTSSASANAATLLQPDGDVFNFDSHGSPQSSRVSSARDVTRTGSSADFTYTFVKNATSLYDVLKSVQDPSGATVATFSWSGGQLTSITSTGYTTNGRTWNFTYTDTFTNGGKLSQITMVNDTPETQTTTKQTITRVFAYDTNGLLNQVKNGYQVDNTYAGWKLVYALDTAPTPNIYRVGSLSAPGAAAGDQWTFTATDFGGATYVNQAGFIGGSGL